MDQHKYHQHHSNAGNDNIYSTDDVEKDENVSPCNPKSDPSSYPKAEKYEQRSIIFKNLSDRTTHQDLVHVVRGGLLLDVHLRSQDKSAIVSFAQGSAAQEFFAYVRRNDVYIHGRRVRSKADL